MGNDTRSDAMTDRTPVAVLGTLAEFHREPIPYDLKALVQLVTAVQPDLLCLDITAEQWRRRDFAELPPEYRDGLLPLARQTDMVVVPIAEDRPPGEPTASGWRGRAIHGLRGWLAGLQRRAPGPAAINQGPRHEIANLLYHLIAVLAGGDGPRPAQGHADYLTQQVCALAHRETGRRILVVVNVRYCHLIRARLGQHPEIEIRGYAQL
jgi:hypothetical protein